MRLGVAGAVRTAVSEPEVMLRLSERPADIVLADTALTRPDSAGFTRRVLAKAPNAVIVLFGPEEPRVAAAAIAAGARGLIHGGADQDLVSVVAKTLLLLCTPRPAVAGGTGSVRPAAVGRTAFGAAAGLRPGVTAGVRVPGGRPTADVARPVGAGVAGPGQPDGATMVPAQRGDEIGRGVPGSGRGARGVVIERPLAPGARPGEASGAPRRITLTERELQVLRGMAEGKSNAEIGRDLFVSEDTVKTHARRLFRKLGARDRAHAVAAGFRAGLVA